MDKIRIRKLISSLAKRDYRRMYMNDFFLTWEKTDLYNAALDLAFFNNRLMITAEGYISKTRDLLRQEGFSEEAIASVHLPIGLPILAQTPAEIAISIAGEMIRCRAEAAQKR